MFKKIAFWLDNARYNALVQSVLPAFLAVWVAHSEPGFSLLCAILAVIGIAFAHLGMNLLDDYFDYRKKGAQIRDHLAAAGFRARIAKCPYLTSGAATEKDLLLAIGVFGALALACGAVIFALRGLPILYITLIAGFLGYSYSGPPLRLGYLGLGELVIVLMFGPCLMAGAYVSACGTFSPYILFLSAPIGLWVGNIVYTHSIMDCEPDRSVHKMTLAVLLNSKAGMLAVSACFIFLPYLIIIAGIVCKYLSVWYLTVLISLPMAIGLWRMMLVFVKNPKQVVERKWWMGPIERWKEICEADLQWFMVRWFTARNLLMILSLIIFVVEFFV